MPPISHKKLQELFAQLMRIEEHRSAQAVKEIKKIYKSLLKDLQYYVSGIYANYAADDSLTYFISSRQVEYARFLEAVRDHFLDAWDSNVQIITNTVEDVYKIAFNGFLNAVNTAANNDEIRKLFKDIRLTNADVIKAAVTNPVAHLTLSRTLNKNRAVIIDRITRTIESGIIAGDRYSTMANKLVDAVGFGRAKAMRVIRTETHRVREEGHNNAANDMDEKLKAAGSPYRWIKTWHNMQDSLVRGNPSGKYKHSPPDHWDMQGVTVLQNESFTLTSKKRGLVSAVCPGQSGTPDNDCNCRCYTSHDLLSDDEFFKLTGRHFTDPLTSENPSAKAPDVLPSASVNKSASRKADMIGHTAEITDVSTGHNVGKSEKVYKDEKIPPKDLKSVDNSPKSDIIKLEVEKGNIKLEVNHEKQAKHIKGMPEYKDGKSYITISEQEVQDIINSKSGTGEIILNKDGRPAKEKIQCDKIIGVDVDYKTGKETPTDKATIHYSKTGTHLVPRKES